MSSASSDAAGPLLVLHHFRDLADPRQSYKVDYPLGTLLLVAFAAVLSGYHEWDAMALFAQERAAWLRALVPLPDRTPSADTLRRVFERLNPQAFRAAFEAWMADLHGQLRGAHLAVDGKSVKGAYDPGKPTQPLHLLHVFAVGRRLLLGLRAVDGAPGEPAATEQALGLLELRAAVVTADAGGCTRGVARAVVKGQGDYVLHLKANRGPQHAEAAAVFAAHDAEHGHGLAAAREVTANGGHGRQELRAVRSLGAEAFARCTALFPELGSVTCLERLRRTANGCSYERQFYVSSLPPDAERIAALVRAHWGVENHLHHALDVVLHEDASRVRKGPAAENLAVVRRAALALLRHDTRAKQSLPKRVQRAALNDAYRLRLLTGQNS